MKEKYPLEKTALYSRGGESRSLQEIVETVDSDVFSLLGNRKLVGNTDFLKRPSYFFDGDYIGLFADYVEDAKGVVDFSSEDFRVVAEGYMAKLANLSRQDVSLNETSLGEKERKKLRRGSFRRNLPVFASTLIYSLASLAASFVVSGAALNFRYSTQSSYPLSRSVENCLRTIRGIPDGRSFYIWSENPVVQNMFSATKAIDEYILNDAVVSHVGAVLPFLAAAAVVGSGIGYIRGRTRKEISQAQLRYKLSSDERRDIHSELLKDLTIPGKMREMAENYRGFYSLQ